MRGFLIFMAILVLLIFCFSGLDMLFITSVDGGTIMEAYYHAMGSFSIALGLFGFSLLLGFSALISRKKEKDEN